MRARAAAVAGLALAVALTAAPLRADVIADAEAAAAGLRATVTALDAAGGGRERVAALTETIRAYEAGLAALREGLRRAALREAAIAADLGAERDRLSRLLGAMMVIEGSPAPLALLHPDGPEAAVRAGMILADVTPAIEAEVADMRAELEEVAAIRRLEETATATLAEGLVAAQEARSRLSQAMQDRSALPRRFLEDPEEVSALVAGAETLDGFARGLARIEQDIGPPMEDFAAARGSLPLPVLGGLLRRAGEADAAGIRRPGILIATRPAALVTSPWPATIRYRGPLLDYGNVMVLEPADGYFLVLAGLGTVYGETGDVIGAGAPVGLMAGAEPGAAALLPAADAAGAGRTETLYIELRQGGQPVDPAAWFTETKED